MGVSPVRRSVDGTGIDWSGIRNAFEEEQREDVGLEVCSIHRPAKNVRGFPQVIGESREICVVISHLGSLPPSEIWVHRSRLRDEDKALLLARNKNRRQRLFDSTSFNGS